MNPSELSPSSITGEKEDAPSTSTQQELSSLKDTIEQLKAQSAKFNKFMDFMMQQDGDTSDCDIDHDSTIASPATESQDISNDLTPNTSMNTLDISTTDPFLFMKEKYTPKQKLGNPVNENLASLVDTIMTKQQTWEQIKELKNTISRPENIKYLVSPQVNKEIWDMVPHDCQQSDVKLQKIQQNIVQGMIPIVECLDMESISEEMKQKMMNSITLLGNAHMEMNVLRRNELKPKMKAVKGLNHRDVPITTQLFGDDLEGEIKKLEQKKKLASSVASTSSNFDRQPQQQRRFHPYASASFQSFKDKAKSFLGRDGLVRPKFQNNPQQPNQYQRSYQSSRGYKGKKEKLNPKQVKYSFGGRLKDFRERWRKISQDKTFLDLID